MDDHAGCDVENMSMRRRPTANDAEETEIAKKETRAVERGKIFVVLFILLSAAGMGIATYVFTSSEERRVFENTFNDFGEEVISIAKSNVEQTVAFSSSIGTAITSYAKGTNANFPLVTLPDFGIRAQQVFDLAGIDMLGYTPIVAFEDKPAYEAYTVQNQGWIAEDLAVQGTPVEDPQSIIPFLYDGTGGIPQDRYIPVWSTAPVFYPPQLYNVDLLTLVDWYKRLVEEVEVVRHPILSETLNLTGVVPDDRPRSIALIPVYETFRTNATIVGFLFIIVLWESFFENILPSDAGELKVLVTDSCGSSALYSIEGGNSTFVGSNITEDQLGDELSLDSPIGIFGNTEGVQCLHRVSVYSTASFRSRYQSNEPVVYTTAVVMIFLCTATFFFVYDWLVTQRQRKVMLTAQNSNKIVSSLFPKNVQQRLMDEAKQREHSAPKGRRVNFFPSPDSGEDQLSGKGGKPIADLFPESSIFFADIAGFTAWSSAREPAQVFTLLETLYHAFDETADRLGVFKIETIGDCYVAVTGVPTPRADHAVVMAKFARQVRKKFGELTRSLDVELGPGTADLGLRIGLHSGPVTAAVLRGARARFQLFGDSVNTTSRIESTGQGGKIHTSKEFAEQLKHMGKGNWVVPRRGKVVAKGKGELETYWLTNAATDGQLDAATGNDRNDREDSLELSIHTSEKSKRLVDWAVEALTGLLEKVLSERQNRAAAESCSGADSNLDVLEQQSISETAIDCIPEFIKFPKINKDVVSPEQAPISLNVDVKAQLVNYVQTVAALYRENKFHNFEHAVHVTMSAMKLVSYMSETPHDQGHKDGSGIGTDALVHFTVALAAIIHDVDHQGIPNGALMTEYPALAELYKNESIAECNSFDVSWRLLMQDEFSALRRAIYTTPQEFTRFREILVTLVRATDVMDKKLVAARQERWNEVFASKVLPSNIKEKRATVVLEHLIQAADISHTMQHWHTYIKWNELLFQENYLAFQQGRIDKDPQISWYQGEMDFFDFYVIPLAERLKEYRALGVSTNESLSYASQNRDEWEGKGNEIVVQYIRHAEYLSTGAKKELL